MEYNIKKKTKHHINLKTNNFIHENTQKETFFNELLLTLNQELDPKEFAFLTTYLLYQENPIKKHKAESKLYTHNKISTQPDERYFNINEIDPTIFQEPQSKRNLIKIKNLENYQSERTKECCTATPRERIKEVIFENKRILNLDKKLNKKYFHHQPDSTRFSESEFSKNTQSSRAKFFIPKFEGLLSSTNRNPQEESYINPMSKMSIKRFTKRNMTVNDNMRRLQTSMSPRDYDQIKGFDSFEIPKFRESEFYIKDLNMRKRDFKKEKELTSEQLRKSENSVPKEFMDHVLLSRKDSKRRLLNRNFSEFKINSRYKQFVC